MSDTSPATWEQRDALDAIELPPPGTARRGHLRFGHPTLADWAWPYVAVRGADDGPRLALLSGVHPAEYPAIEANIRLMRRLDPARLRGSVVSVPVVDLPAFLLRTPFVNPLDGKNPNRAFPGDPQGSFTDVMTDALFRAVVAPADALLDLHGGDVVEDLVPFAIYSARGDADLDARSAALGRAFGLPLLLAAQPRPGVQGTTVQAAATAGIPALLAEAGGRGLLTEPETRLLVDGVDRVLRHLGMLDGPPPPATTPVELSRYTVVASPAEGMWYPAVAPGEVVAEGQTLGRVADLFGEPLAEIAAPHAGHVLYVTSSPAMRQDGLALALGGT